MAHNARIRVMGQWVAVTAIDPDELETFDLRQYESINGDLGGTWAPADVIVIGGSGLDVTGAFSALDARAADFADDGLITFADAVAEAPAIQLGEFRTIELEADAAIKLASGAGIAMAAGSSFTMDGVLLVTTGGVSTYQTGTTTTWQSGSNFVIDSGANVANSATLLQGGQFARVGALARSVQSSRHATFTNSDQTLGVEYDVISMTVSGASLVTLTLKIATAPVPLVGEELFIRKLGTGTGGLLVKSEGSASYIVTFGVSTGSCHVFFDGTMWRLAGMPINETALGADAG